MKANYSKPLLAIESFTLAQTIARDCSPVIPKEDLTSGNIDTCVWDMNGTSVFVGGKTCDIDGEMMGIACYNNPAEGMYIFRS